MHFFCQDVTDALDGLLLLGVKLPVLGGLLAKVDVAVSKLLKDVEFLLADILKLVAALSVYPHPVCLCLAYSPTQSRRLGASPQVTRLWSHLGCPRVLIAQVELLVKADVEYNFFLTCHVS